MASIIRCSAAERELHEHFLRALSPACEELGEDPRVAEVAGIVDTLIEVFRALSQPSHESVQGLWTELLLISRARNIELAVESWQPRTRSLVDFEHRNVGLEVKSCAGQVRRNGTGGKISAGWAACCWAARWSTGGSARR